MGRADLEEDDPRHGTNAGYAAHKKRGHQPCLACHDAHAAYMADWRRANPRRCWDCGAPTTRNRCQSCGKKYAWRRRKATIKAMDDRLTAVVGVLDRHVDRMDDDLWQAIADAVSD